MGNFVQAEIAEYKVISEEVDGYEDIVDCSFIFDNRKGENEVFYG
jgi:hypothetical protein